MWTQTSNEENKERDIEINRDYAKAHSFPSTIIGRKRFRDMRNFLYDLGIFLPIPMNSVLFTHAYAMKYGKLEPRPEMWP